MNYRSTYQPRGAAVELFHTQLPEVLIEGPAGTGKTRAVLEKIHHLALRWPGMRALLLRKTRRSMSETVLNTLEQHVLLPNCPIAGGARRSVRDSYIYPNGSTLVVAGIDRPSKIMSSEYDIVACFEASEFSETDWESLLTRLRNGRMPYHQAIADTNPDTPTHWLNQRAARGRMTRLKSRHSDNPAVTAEYLDRLDALTGIRRKRLRDGVWAASEGMVYEGWDRDVHLIDPFPIPQDWRRIRAIDFGYTNPFVCQWWALDNDDRLYLYREIYETRKLVQDMAQRIAVHSRGESIDLTVADHDAEGRATLQRYGIATIAADKSVMSGIQRVINRLQPAGDGRSRLFIMRDCLLHQDPALNRASFPRCTAEEFDGYVWANSTSGHEHPVKIHDHGMDAMRYVVSHVDADASELSVHVTASSQSAPRMTEAWCN